MERELKLEKDEHIILETQTGEVVAVYWDESIKTWVVAADFGKKVMII